MSASIEDVKKFLAEKAKEKNTDTLQVDLVTGTTGATQYKINFIPPAPKKDESEATKKTATPAKKSKD